MLQTTRLTWGCGRTRFAILCFVACCLGIRRMKINVRCVKISVDDLITDCCVLRAALPALTRVTRLDSNFEPVPGSTVPRIAPSLLVTYGPMARHDEEVHVALPPIKASHHAKTPYNTVSVRYSFLESRVITSMMKTDNKSNKQHARLDAPPKSALPRLGGG